MRNVMRISESVHCVKTEQPFLLRPGACMHYPYHDVIKLKSSSIGPLSKRTWHIYHVSPL